MRLDKALVNIKDKSLSYEIRKAFEASDTLEDALFSPTLKELRRHQEFETFVRNYTESQYDFLPFKSQLGERNFVLLNRMQSRDPAERSDIEECFSLLEENRSAPELSRLDNVYLN
ncbi:hypothetical protein ACQUW5_10825 [Legionella sp. CNM-1927-20]|uniref:hypothetical protein n=1 Tax=Legionella sp. CNM-1927-20 TaxID=3422221 RepID=UPI00403B17B6